MLVIVLTIFTVACAVTAVATLVHWTSVRRRAGDARNNAAG